jgi:hypothetical protein
MAHALAGGIEQRRHVVDDLRLQRASALARQYSGWRLLSQYLQALVSGG